MGPAHSARTPTPGYLRRPLRQCIGQSQSQEGQQPRGADRGKWVKWRTLILRSWAVDPELCPRCHKEMKRAGAWTKLHGACFSSMNCKGCSRIWASGFIPLGHAHHRPPSVRTWLKNRCSPTAKARSRPDGMSGKRPDQAPTQLGYWPWPALTAKFLRQNCISARNLPLLANLPRILRPT